MLRFFALLTGDRHAVLAQHGPASRRKVVAMGSGLLLVTGLWVFTGFNLATNVFGMDVRPAVATGFVLGTVVFMVDRLFLLGMNGHRSVVATRLALALLMSIIGGIGLDLYFMRSEIEQTLIHVHQEDRTRMMEAIDHRYAQQRAKAQQATAGARMALAAAETDWRQEMDGSAGTGRYGVGAVARAKGAIVDDRKLDLAAAQAQESRLYALVAAEQQAKAAQLDSAQRKGGLFERIHAMHRYMVSSPLVLVSYLVVTIILVLFELSPLLVKLGYPKTAYEQGVELADQLEQERMNAIRIAQGRFNQRFAAMSAEEHRAQARLVAITNAYNRLS
ncbi:MAG: DUF4407 domain-containing protein [Flavobacteriales bacterium]|nr:DUF4407 domain-containing protein [Flavobacteriales bacterium]